jgi:hypothetical protein
MSGLGQGVAVLMRRSSRIGSQIMLVGIARTWRPANLPYFPEDEPPRLSFAHVTSLGSIRKDFPKLSVDPAD